MEELKGDNIIINENFEEEIFNISKNTKYHNETK